MSHDKQCPDLACLHCRRLISRSSQQLSQDLQVGPCTGWHHANSRVGARPQPLLHLSAACCPQMVLYHVPGIGIL